MRFRSSVLTVSAALMLWAVPSFAGPQAIANDQSNPRVHVVDAAGLRQALLGQRATDQQNRDTVLNLLRTPEARAAASKLGLTVSGVEGAVATLDSAELAKIATTAKAATVQRAGGDTIVISVTTLLLIIIIIILVAD